MAGVQNQWYHFGTGAPPILGLFRGDWDVHGGYDLGVDPHRHTDFSQSFGPRSISPHAAEARRLGHMCSRDVKPPVHRAGLVFSEWTALH